MVALRDYQRTAVETTLSALDTHERVLVVAPTGAGKTVIGSAVVSRVLERGARVLWLAHRRELIDQAAAALERAVGERPGIILAGRPATPGARAQVASVQTLTRREVPEDIALVVVDEAHHTEARTYKRLLERAAGARVVGLTATPCRADGRGLGDTYQHLVVAAPPSRLVADGHLAAPRVFAVRAPVDLDSITVRAGDYSLDELERAVDRPEVTCEIVRAWRERASDRTTVVFATGVEHSRSITRAFNDAGIRAEHLDGETPNDVRAAILARLASGETQLVSNVGVLTEGWDLPRCKCVVLARPTKSLALYLQMAGRGLRPWNNAPPIMLDLGGSTLDHGLPLDDREWSLTQTRERKRQEKRARQCPQCDAIVAQNARQCPHCGFVFPRTPRVQTVLNKRVELFELDERRVRYAELLREASRRGYARGWAAHRFREHYGVFPPTGREPDAHDYDQLRRLFY